MSNGKYSLIISWFIWYLDSNKLLWKYIKSQIFNFPSKGEFLFLDSSSFNFVNVEISCCAGFSNFSMRSIKLEMLVWGISKVEKEKN